MLLILFSSNPKMKTCSHCKKELGFSSFYKNRSKKDGLSIHCRDCQNSFNRKGKKKATDKRELLLTQETFIRKIQLLSRENEKRNKKLGTSASIISDRDFLIKEMLEWLYKHQNTFIYYTLKRMGLRERDAAVMIFEDAVSMLTEDYLMTDKCVTLFHAKCLMYRFVNKYFSKFCAQRYDDKWLAEWEGNPPYGSVPPSVLFQRQRMKRYRERVLSEPKTAEVYKERCRQSKERYLERLREDPRRLANYKEKRRIAARERYYA